MTVKELREKLLKFDDKADVTVYWEEGKEDQFFEIDDVSLHKGTSGRINGKAAFTLDSKGPAERLFISIGPA